MRLPAIAFHLVFVVKSEEARPLDAGVEGSPGDKKENITS